MLDVVIVGGGPAGLNAALFLGRSRRAVVLVDSGRPRNTRSRRVTGFLSRDGMAPHDLRREARDQLAAYDTVELRDGEAVTARREADGFSVDLGGGETLRARKLVLAPGLMDDAPPFPDAAAFYARGVYPCPYCDGWEHRDEPLLAFGRGSAGRGVALELTAWSSRVTLLTHGPADLSAHHADDLARRGIAVVEAPIVGIDGDPDGDGMEAIRLADGSRRESRALFFAFDECRQSPLVAQLGCDLGETGGVETRHGERTNVPGLFVAGDASRRVKFAIVAAAEGAMAAFAAHTELLQEDLHAGRRLPA